MAIRASGKIIITDRVVISPPGPPPTLIRVDSTIIRAADVLVRIGG